MTGVSDAMKGMLKHRREINASCQHQNNITLFILVKHVAAPDIVIPAEVVQPVPFTDEDPALAPPSLF